MPRTSLHFALIAPLLALAVHADSNWPQFRGPGGMGVAGGKTPPTQWDVEKGENVLWKTPIAGLGCSSPVIWGDKLFVTTAVPKSGDATLKVGLYGDIKPVDDDTPQSWRVICLDKKTGKVIWDREACAGSPKVKRHPKCSHANSTVATDGEHVVAFFGSEGLYCFDVNGELKWKKDFGVLDSGFYMVKGAQWGFGASPVIHDGKLLIQADVQENSFLALLDLKDGREIWRTPRTDVPTWSSPAVYEHKGGKRIAVNGWKHIGGYDFATGKEIWKLTGGGDIPVPTPIVAKDLIYITNAHGSMRPVYAIRTDAEGDITPDEPGQGTRFVQWWTDRRGNYMQTPVVIGDVLYLCFDNGLLSALEADSGEEVWKQRLGGGTTGFTPSLVACGETLYATSEMGDVYVLKHGREFQPIATNELHEACMATPAISDGVIYFRGEKHLIAIGSR